MISEKVGRIELFSARKVRNASRLGSQIMKCKGCGKQLVNEEEGQLGLCPGCWEELCDLSLWQNLDAVAEGAD